MKHENDETELIIVPDNYLVINNTIGLNVLKIIKKIILLRYKKVISRGYLSLYRPFLVVIVFVNLLKDLS